jgi:hypothetical protein
MGERYMNPIVPPLNSILSLVPEVERGDTWQLVLAVTGLERFVQDFRAAVDLFNFSALEMHRARSERDLARAASGSAVDGLNLWKENSTRFGAWQHISARDGALQIYHMGIVMEKIKGQLNNVPTIRPLVDSSQLRTTVRLFQSYFPKYRLIRDAVAHSNIELAPSAGTFRCQAPDVIDIPSLAKGRGIFITNALYGNRYIITKDKMVASYEISDASYAKLESVRARFIAGFDNARAEVVKDWPKPQSWDRLKAP